MIVRLFSNKTGQELLSSNSRALSILAAVSGMNGREIFEYRAIKLNENRIIQAARAGFSLKCVQGAAN